MFGLIPWRKEKGAEKALAQREDNPFALFRREFDTLFDRMFSPWLAPQEWGGLGWGFRMEEGDKEVLVRAEAPGFEAGDFDVSVTGDTLHIRAERKSEDKGNGTYGRLERWVTLPPGTERDKVEASYRNGVLEVRLPRAPEALGRRIEVKT